ncbi:hypothetical protein GCM10017687_81130 [Streptomyces echinatus]
MCPVGPCLSSAASDESTLAGRADLTHAPVIVAAACNEERSYAARSGRARRPLKNVDRDSTEAAAPRSEPAPRGYQFQPDRLPAEPSGPITRELRHQLIRL